MLVHLVAAARPNFVKIAPLYRELAAAPWCEAALIHPGQHYDFQMSQAFFRDLELPAPDFHLGVGSGSHAQQTGRVLMAYEEVLVAERPDWVVVAGDVNATLACTLAAKKLNLRVAHVEAGLRSFDRSMPEELNRVLTDAVADLLWTPSPDADENLRREGVRPAAVVRVGNLMIDSLERLREPIARARAWEPRGLRPGAYGVVTMHRPSNVDQPATFRTILAALAQVAGRLPLVFPVHPRTRARLAEFGLTAPPGLRLSEPAGYLEFLSLVAAARLVITDSGGLQEETTHLGVPCLTLRTSTERPITVTQGTNRLVRPGDLAAAAAAALAAPLPGPVRLELWDGHAAERAAASLRQAEGE
ncbi:MAG: UDP-N-acetylglucosamine 2-epimerase (non-hydrolyzing) [Deltaproteobacteria bacterium]|nr:UDP-N-acetylglucosamine 2-epimerase (non-hydrolyzing) [Deltaproteobacteria bacterium]